MIRAAIVFAGVWTLTFFFGDAPWLAAVADTGTIETLNETAQLALAVLVFNWLFYPSIDYLRLLRDGTISGDDGVPVNAQPGAVQGYSFALGMFTMAMGLVIYT